ncbi:MAG: chromosome segregation protein SMC [Xanthomonadaceae bacterium]|nr:chromosome segregation protein SMC [Xanthomonadaceae bacterium]
MTVLFFVFSDLLDTLSYGMRVKRLEVQGFKSFKDKTVIHFDHGITGIVGPNGCGKSNIVDAFFWVMGEQSYKHIRGSNAEDLIFNGSSKYQPLPYAEATLVMEVPQVDPATAPAGASLDPALSLSTQMKEVSVTRRVNRQGEGEYFINGITARLKDIHELFMDTGIGAKGYSVIEQGQIGKIVNSKPEDRRLLVEEAAGIAKYKSRKKESLRKLESAKANLSRLNDVLQEIERNLSSLERQAQKANRYKEYKKELFEKEISWGRRKFKILSEKIEFIKLERETFEQDLIGLKSTLSTSENELEIQRINQVQDQKLSDDLQVLIQTISTDLTHEQSALDLSRRRQGDLDQQIQSFTIEQSELSQNLLESKERTLTQENELTHIQSQFASHEAEINSFSIQTDTLMKEVNETRAVLDQAKQELISNVNRRSELSAQLAATGAKIESLTDQKHSFETSLTEIAEQVATLNAQSDTAIASLSEQESSMNAVSSEIQAASSTLTSLQEQTYNEIQARDSLHKKLTQTESRLNSLKELNDQFEGLGDGPKAVMEWARASGMSENFQLLADSIEVKQGYEKSLEGFLESLLELIFVGNPTDAITAFQYLRERIKGRAAFQSIQLMPNATIENIPYEKLASLGVVLHGSLLDFLTFKSTSNIDAFTHQLFSKAFVVESISPLLLNCISNGATLAQFSGFTFVDLNGDSVDANGTLRGGSTTVDQTVSILGRKRLIQELATQTDAQTQEYQSSIARVTECETATVTAKQAIETLKSRMISIEMNVFSSKKDISSLKLQILDLEKQSLKMNSECERIRISLDESANEKIQIVSQLESINASQSNLESKLLNDDSVLGKKSLELQALNNVLQSKRIDEASKKERLQSLKRELESANQFINQKELRLEEIKRLLERVTDERLQFVNSDDSMKSTIERLQRELSEKQTELAAVKYKLDQASLALNLGLDQIKDLHKKSEEKSTAVNQLAIDIERMSGEISHLSLNLEEKYGVGCLTEPIDQAPIQEEMTNPVITGEMSAEDEKQLFETVEQLKEKIRKLGEVNVMAVEEFEEMKKRFEYLNGEKLDLEKSIENLNAAIDHINKTSEERFQKAFEAIADRFQKLFPIIFGGGSATLTLVYPEGSTDILEAGVEIMAQPPGKKVSNITLLSGGEKALTAISLIFSIFLIKPSPFCLLDEVDAPLDDSNIGKFNALLREMSAKSQFIVITHNKKTMELNDTLYGVTMEEPGVSKVVSVELN